MAFAVQMRLEPELEQAMAAFKTNDNQRALVITIEGEAMHKKSGPTDKTKDFGADLDVLKGEMKKVGADVACYVLLRVGNDGSNDYALLMYVPESTKPKHKMMFASSALHLRNSCNLGIAGETRVENIEDIRPKLFNVTEEEKKEMRTETEVIKEEVSKMEIAPMTAANMGLGCILNDDVKAALTDVKDKKCRGVIVALEGSKIVFDKKVENDSPNAIMHRGFSADHPRFSVLNWEEDKEKESKYIMAYVCPAGAKPKEKMPYASTKSSFVKAVEAEGVKITKAVEMAEPSSLEQIIKEHLADIEAGGAATKEDEMKPIAPAKLGAKGPRMLI